MDGGKRCENANVDVNVYLKAGGGQLRKPLLL